MLTSDEHDSACRTALESPEPNFGPANERRDNPGDRPCGLADYAIRVARLALPVSNYAGGGLPFSPGADDRLRRLCGTQ